MSGGSSSSGSALRRPAAPVFQTAPLKRPVGGGGALTEEDNRPLSADEVQAKIDAFHGFVETKLKVDLNRVLDERDRIYQKTAD